MITTESNEEENLKALILAGGKSTRLGKDKSLLQWYDKEQVYYQFDLLKKYCSSVFVSKAIFDESIRLPQILDSFNVKGPYAGILSALKFDNKCAWLVVACDLPLFNEEDIQKLIKARDSNKIATAFTSPRDSTPEPLAAIWEPKSFDILKTFLSNGYSCPRKVLMLNDIKLIEPDNTESLLNVNRQEDVDRVELILTNRKLSI
ncbi:MAG: hypothetical protein NVS3B19_16720 [Ginsengibacter sp.]